MGQVSYSDLFGIDHSRGYDQAIVAGDLVRMGANLFPHYNVVAVAGDKVWVRNADNGADGITSLDRCRKVEA